MQAEVGFGRADMYRLMAVQQLVKNQGAASSAEVNQALDAAKFKADLHKSKLA